MLSAQQTDTVQTPACRPVFRDGTMALCQGPLAQYQGPAHLRGPTLNTTVTKSTILASKCTSNYLAAGLRPDPPGELTCSRYPLAGFNGWALGKEEDKEGREGRDKRESGMGGRGKEERRGKRKKEKGEEISLKSVPMGPAGWQVSARGPAVAKYGSDTGIVKFYISSTNISF